MSYLLHLRGDINNINSDKKLSINLNGESKKAYEKIFLKKTIAFPELLNCVDFIINRSMKYDFNPQKHLIINTDSLCTDIEKEYKPIGDETLNGICTDAGSYIRQLLGSLNLEANIKYIKLSVRGEKYTHDTTLVFDIMKGSWGIINSKSPLKEKQFNFASTDIERKKLGIDFLSYLSHLQGDI